MAKDRVPLPHIPIGLIEEILKQLPFKTLVRFKCVSKQWSSLIHDRRFIKAHYDHATSTGNNATAWRYARVRRYGHHREHSLYITDCDKNHKNVRLSDVVTGGPYDLTFEPAICGSLHGLLLLRISQLGFILWNPTTRSSWRIKDLNPQVQPVKNTVSGLGYDHQTDDFKVVVVIFGIWRIHSYVFSFRRNSWTNVNDGFRWDPTDIFRSSGTVLNGHPHWLLQSLMNPKTFSIVGFDPVTEKFREVPLPDWPWHYVDALRFEDSSIEFGSLGGFLCITHKINNRSDARLVEVWLMKEYGVQESWTMMHELKVPCGVRQSLKPVAYWSKAGNYVIMERVEKELAMYNVQGNGNGNGKRKIADLGNCVGDAWIYVETIACP